jgi:hypothetical protein
MKPGEEQIFDCECGGRIRMITLDDHHVSWQHSNSHGGAECASYKARVEGAVRRVGGHFVKQGKT